METKINMTNKLTFCFSDEMIDTALRANGWSEGWTDEYWVHESNEYADYGGYFLYPWQSRGAYLP